MLNWKQYLEVYRVQLKNNFIREAVYRTNFLTAIIVDLIWMGVELSLFSILYSNVDQIAGWTRMQVYFFLGVFFSSDALFTVLFQKSFWNFSDLVNKGELDILLTKPINSLFLALTRSINLSAICNVIAGVSISIHYAKPAGFAGGWAWFQFVGWLLIGLIIALELRFVFSVFVFWTDRSWALVRLYYQLFHFATKPDSLYPKAIRYLILSIIPFGFIGSVPARALLNGLNKSEYYLLISILIGFYGLGQCLWHLGLKRYQSASS